jgi:hypothetical protein
MRKLANTITEAISNFFRMLLLKDFHRMIYFSKNFYVLARATGTRQPLSFILPAACARRGLSTNFLSL